ncbi:MAG TPA: sugar phosphate isomerase/epimerase [Chloroflexota bacterium]|nr:sugar phosphate isomerase/epimerase [Chloroflexota bacterium]
MKLGYSTWSTQTMPLEEAIRELARIGYDGVEIAVNPGWTGHVDDLDGAARQRIRRLLDDTGVELSALVSGHRNQVAEPAEYEQGKQRYLRELDLALEWAKPGLIPSMDVAVGGRSEQWEELKQLIVERVGETVALAAERNVVVALEPHVGQAIDRPEKMLWVIEQVSSPFCKVNFDISHFEVQGIPMAHSIPLMAPHTEHVHIKDERGLAPNHEFLIPGEGEFDYVKYLTLMDRHGYRGHISPEISIMVQRRPNYDPIAAMEQTYRVVADAFERSGVPRERRALRG